MSPVSLGFRPSELECFALRLDRLGGADAHHHERHCEGAALARNVRYSWTRCCQFIMLPPGAVEFAGSAKHIC